MIFTKAFLSKAKNITDKIKPVEVFENITIQDIQHCFDNRKGYDSHNTHSYEYDSYRRFSETKQRELDTINKLRREIESLIAQNKELR